MGNANVNEKGLLYGKFQTGPHTWSITVQGSCQFVYLLVGTKKAMLIDTFYGFGNLREVVESITDLPVMVCNTHGHFDHTGGNAFWEECYMGQEATLDCKKAFGPEMEKMLQSMPHPNYKCNVLNDGDIIDLGGFTVEIIRIGAHHSGSIAFLDHGERIIYCGDELEAGQVLINRKDVPVHLENMKKLKGRSDEFDFINTAHNGTHLIKDYIDDFIKLDEGILDGSIQPEETPAGFGWASKPTPGTDRYQYGRVSMCCILAWNSGPNSGNESGMI